MHPPRFDHAKLRAYQEAVLFASWVEPIMEKLSSKLAAKNQLDRASISIALNIAEGNGKRSHPHRCRYLDLARGSALESAAYLDVLVARGELAAEEIEEGKYILLTVVSLIAGLSARFSRELREDEADYGSKLVEEENE